VAGLLARWFGRKREAKYDSLELFREIYGGRPTWSGNTVNLETMLAVSAALACGRVIAEGLALMPFKVYLRAERSTAPAPKHPLYDKLATSPNPLQTAFEFVETLGLHLAFCGNAYVYMQRVGGFFDGRTIRQVDAMYLLDPKWLTVKHEWPKLPTYTVRIDGGRTMELTSDDVWHIRGPSWTSYCGLDMMKIARQAVGLSMALEEGQAKLQSKGVSMPGYLKVDGSLTEDQQKKLAKWIEDEHSGSANTGKPMILDRAADWVKTAMTNVDAQTMEQRRLQIEEVCRFMRVLPIMIGHADKTATYASAEQMFLAHAMYTLGPWARRLEQSADKFLLSPEERAAGYYTNLNEKALQRMTARDQMDYLARGVVGGILMQNEAREVLDLNPADGGDVLLSPANTFSGPPPEAPAPKPQQPPGE
jgi:HK97 family phage portal protein